MYLFHSLGITENYMLNVMAYDRYVAICNPLQYHVIMTSKFCKILICSCWFIGFMSPLSLLILLSQLSFCGSNEIFHVFCDSSPLLNLACVDTSASHILDFAIGLGMIIITSAFILLIYVRIMVTILNMKLAEERKRAFSTCFSHFVIVLIFYASVAFMYTVLHGDYTAELEQAVAINYSVLTPLFNPIIYSFRNKEIKNGLKKIFQPMKLVNVNNFNLN
ncbi:olfactory receptor 6N2-like [Discoglossus pictus]